MTAEWQKRGPEAYKPLQRRILAAAAAMLKPGGLLLYSTCTFDRGEDEEAAARLLEEAEDLEQIPLTPRWGMSQGADGASLRLFPWKLRGEGHFVSLFRKRCGEAPAVDREADLDRRVSHNRAFLKKQKDFAQFRGQILAPLEERGFYWEKGGQLYLLPVPPQELPPVRYLRTGLFLGTVKRERFEPSQALAMYLKKEEFAGIEELSPSDLRVVKYLKGETIQSDLAEGSGWRLLCAGGWPLGFVKKNGISLKNKYYPGWRWQ